MLKYTLLSLLLVLAIYNANAEIEGMVSQEAAFEKVVVADIGDDVIRGYSYISTLNGFTLWGISVEGSIGRDSAKGSFDTSSFSFVASNVLSQLYYSFNYFSAKVDSGSGVESKALGSIYAPTTLVEYKETNGVDGFQYGADKILGWVRVDKYGPYSIDKSSKDFNTTDGKTFKVYTIDAKSQNELFNLRFYVSDHPVTVDGNPISSEETKADIFINGYYNTQKNQQSMGCTVNSVPVFKCKSTGPSNDAESRLALVSYYLVSKFDFDVDFSTGELKVDGSEISAGFSWVSNVDVSKGGVNTNVKVNANIVGLGNATQYGEIDFVGSNNGGIMVHSFDAVRPDSLTWDPTFGGSPAGSYSSKIVVPSVLIVLLAVFALLF